MKKEGRFLFDIDGWVGGCIDLKHFKNDLEGNERKSS